VAHDTALNCEPDRLESLRVNLVSGLAKKHRAAFGQFFTPNAVASYMASLLTFEEGLPVRLLDAGAGIGALTAAVAQQAAPSKVGRFEADCYEVEPKFQAELRRTLARIPTLRGSINSRDFIQDAVSLATAGKAPAYTHAILNPPYKKINTASKHRQLLRRLGVETSNLYTCFLACAIALCGPGAQVVAIIPRSFMNGLYFKPFRLWLLSRVALTHIHVFESRAKAFADDDVLQENVILRMVVGASQQSVQVSVSTDARFHDNVARDCAFDEIVTADDAQHFIHIPDVGKSRAAALQGSTLREIGMDVCTGPVVDFRLRAHIQQNAGSKAAALLYPAHFAGGSFQWPKVGRKPNAIAVNSETKKWLMPKGCYIVLRRFTAKEERRRVVAYYFDGRELPGKWIGFENHLNVIHRDREGLPEDLARGLVRYLNSQAVDDYFRTFSGHTQVNATDLRRLKYPSGAELRRMGSRTVPAGPGR
jgi:adenine-specific DNA-methyltransferase